MPHAPSPPPGSDPLRTHLLVATLIATLAWGADASGLDHLLASAAFDPELGTFPARASASLELFGHRLAKSAVWLVWFGLLATALASLRLTALEPWRRVLWATTGAMAAGPAVVTLLKGVTGPRCPWDLVAFGGQASVATAWLVDRAEAGRCFPGGHASGGFSLLALYFAGVAVGAPRLRAAGLAAGLGAGLAFSAVRMLQGAHFLSHNLWAAFVVWTVAVAVFAIVYPGPPATTVTAKARTA
ncbi:MAG: phosphatase PAP2 family protein [Burkholderiales bacterium]|nr:MAG: phosphatase PAP2 family protein [Burkholderiales bacterium]